MKSELKKMNELQAQTIQAYRDKIIKMSELTDMLYEGYEESGDTRFYHIYKQIKKLGEI